MHQASPSYAVAYGAPFGRDRYFAAHSEPKTILELVATVPSLPATFAQDGVVCVNGIPVPREMWAHVRPRPAGRVPVAVTLHQRLGRGQGLQLAAAIALIAATAAISAWGVPFLGPAFAAGTFGAKALAGAVAIGGALAISALSPPPTLPGDPKTDDNADRSASAQGNVLEANGPIPRVIGTHKVFPKLACEPLTEIVGEKEKVEAVYVLAGPHALNDIRIGGAPIDDIPDLDYQTREGWPSDTALTLVTRFGKTLSPQIEMTQHEVRDGNEDTLKEEGDPEDHLPQWHPLTGRLNPDEIWIHLYLQEGLYDGDAPDNYIAVPFRLRMRERGDLTPGWFNLPEIHLSDRRAILLRKAIVLKWGTAPGVLPEPPEDAGWIRAFADVPPQASAPVDEGWQADSSFGGGGSPSVATNIALYEDRVEIFLDENAIPKGRYEIQIKRGVAHRKGELDDSDYELDGTVRDLFGYRTTIGDLAEIPQSQKNRHSRVTIVRVSSVWNEAPISKIGKVAQVAVVATARRLDELSVLASGYVKDWDGSGWNTWTTRSNPAPHFVDVMSGALNLDPLPATLRDDTGIVAWRTTCAANDYTVDAIIDGRRTRDVMQLIASCGFARTYSSDLWGVMVDKDRSADTPVQVFSPRNSRDFRWSKAMPRLPDGFRVNYRNEANDYDVEELFVFRPGHEGEEDGRLEQVTFDGFVDETKAEGRAAFDLAQATARGTFYSMETDLEAVVCRRGDLVAVQHDTIEQHAGFARIKEKILDTNGDIIAIRTDARLPIVIEPQFLLDDGFIDFSDNFFFSGQRTGVAIRLSDGSHIIKAVTGLEGGDDYLEMVTPFTDLSGVASGCLVVSGPIGAEYSRMIVMGIEPAQGLTYRMTFVDEAPELWQ